MLAREKYYSLIRHLGPPKILLGLEYVSHLFEYPTRGNEGPKVEDLSPGCEGYLSLGKSLKTGIKRSRFEIIVKFESGTGKKSR